MSDLKKLYLDIHNKMKSEHGFSAKALWGSEQSQRIRFEVLTKCMGSSDSKLTISFHACSSVEGDVLPLKVFPKRGDCLPLKTYTSLAWAACTWVFAHLTINPNDNNTTVLQN